MRVVTLIASRVEDRSSSAMANERAFGPVDQSMPPELEACRRLASTTLLAHELVEPLHVRRVPV